MALAQSWVSVTACDAVAIGEHLYPRIQFEITNLHPQYGGCYFVMFPQEIGAPTDTCSAVQCSGPDDWLFCDISPINGSAFWACTDESIEDYILPGETVTGFEVVLSREDCCFVLNVSNVIPEPFHSEVVCFECELHVQTRTETWGRIKGIHR